MSFQFVLDEIVYFALGDFQFEPAIHYLQSLFSLPDFLNLFFDFLKLNKKIIC